VPPSPHRSPNKPGAGIIPLLLAYIVFFGLLISPVSAVFNTSVSTNIDTVGATPYDIWILAALLSFILFFMSLGTSTSTAELERDALVSGIAWVPIAFTAYASFAVDKITTTGISGSTIVENHTIYHFDVIGILFGVFLLIAIVNTVRILTLHRGLLGQSESNKGGLDE
jgi:hypothetical protein